MGLYRPATPFEDALARGVLALPDLLAYESGRGSGAIGGTPPTVGPSTWTDHAAAGWARNADGVGVGGGGTKALTLDVGAPNVRIDCTVVHGTSLARGRLAIRYIDADNLVLARNNTVSGTHRLIISQRVAGVQTDLIDTVVYAPASLTGVALDWRVYAIGNFVTFTINGTTTTVAIPSGFAAATRFGFDRIDSSAATRYRDFVVRGL
jgi:hypothetical protein